MQNERFRRHAQPSRFSWGDSDAHQITAIAENTWREIRAVMIPIIGERGFGALVKRSLHLQRMDFPWLAAAYPEAEFTSFDALREATIQQSSPGAVAGHNALIETFCQLLDNLIGESLTQRLLHPVWHHAENARKDAT